MGKKQKHDSKGTKPAEFHNNPFKGLKGLVEPVADKQPEKPAPKKVDEKKTDESRLFLEAMAGVQPLRFIEDPAKPAQSGHSAPATKSGRPLAPKTPEETSSNSLFLEEIKKLKLDVRFEDKLPQDEELHPIDGNKLRQIKRGIISLNRQLDLHGLTREEALESLDSFLKSAMNSSEKAVLVITGKGLHSAGEPVLQQAVAAWLRDQGRKYLLEFAPAPRELGGSGAFVVFLRPLDKPARQ